MVSPPRLAILGGGQLARMMALAAAPLGVRCRVLDPAADAPASDVAEQVVGPFDDHAALDALVRGCDAVTYEFENVPAAVTKHLTQLLPEQAGATRGRVAPPPLALELGQDRLLEKQLFQRVGIDVPPFATATTKAELLAALEVIGFPAVAKARRLGYDGKGQSLIRSRSDVDAAWGVLSASAASVGLLVEAFVPFDREISIIAVRAVDGSTAFYPITQNHHEGGILRRSLAPATDPGERITTQARRHALALLEALEYVGVLAIEFFERGGRLLGNEYAPRVHNSGHWTIEGAATSQFENHVRAVLGMPLGPTHARAPSIMVNLIGGWPEPSLVLAVPGAHLHLYGKQPRPGRKVGHVTLVKRDMDAQGDGEARLHAAAAEIDRLVRVASS
jgi:5-(carboxyamino)imidazole ribonucleotide synthase